MALSSATLDRSLGNVIILDLDDIYSILNEVALAEYFFLVAKNRDDPTNH